MKKEYTLIEQPSGKFFIHYFINNELETIEFYSYADQVPQVEIKQGYVLKLEL